MLRVRIRRVSGDRAITALRFTSPNDTIIERNEGSSDVMLSAVAS